MYKYTDEKIIELIEIAKKNKAEATGVELKDARGGVPRDLWKTISSFSHRPEGGLIVFGVKEDRVSGEIEIVGNYELAERQEQIASYFSERMQNVERPDIRIISYQGYDLIAIIVKETPNESKPCYEKNMGLPNGACIRVGSTDRVINLEEMKQFVRNSSLYKFDKTQALGTSLEMLSEQKLIDFFAKSAKKTGRSLLTRPIDFKILKNLSVVKEFDNKLLPTVAGFMLFAKESPQLVGDFSRYVIRCIRYSGISPASPIVDKVDIEGTLDDQIDQMQKFILRNIPLNAEITGTKRVEKYEYPPEAIRELVANAVVHRDYRMTETYTQVNIFSNRIEISNPGNLPPGVTIETIKESQFSRNEIIAGILKDMDYLEEYGRGIDIVFSRMAEEDLLEPVFKNISNSFKVTLFGKSFKDLNDRQVKMWQLIQDKNRITTKECLVYFKPVSRATISNDLNKLIELNLIKIMGSSNNTYYIPQH